MEYYVGLDDSLKSTHVCVIDPAVDDRGAAEEVERSSCESRTRDGFDDALALPRAEGSGLSGGLHGCAAFRNALKARPEKTDKADA